MVLQVDPLDGTTNFVHGYPFSCVSIGLAIKRTPVVGVVFNPVLGELFTAAAGCGAYLNGKRIQVSDTTGVWLIRHMDQRPRAASLALALGHRSNYGKRDEQ